mgnify:CR=1 FL=1
MEPNLLSKDKCLYIFGTPPKQRSAYYVEYREQLLKDIKQGDSTKAYYEFDASVNPVNDPGLIAAKRKQLIESDNEAIYYREYEGKLCFGGEDVVFPKWNPVTHCRTHKVVMSYLENDKHKLRWYTICDPGTSTCFAVLFAVYNPYTQQIFLIDEIYEKDRKRTDTRQIWDRIRKKESELFVGSQQTDWIRVYDEQAAWFLNEVVANYKHQFAKINLSPSKKQMTDEETDISRIKMLMANTGSLTVSDRCYWLRWEVESFVTDEEGRYPDRNNHLLDCFKYLIQHCNWKLIEKADTNLIPEEVHNQQRNQPSIIKPDEWADNAVSDSLWPNINDTYTDYFN